VYGGNIVRGDPVEITLMEVEGLLNRGREEHRGAS